MATTPDGVTTGDTSPDTCTVIGGAGRSRPLYADKVTPDTNTCVSTGGATVVAGDDPSIKSLVAGSGIHRLPTYVVNVATCQ